MFNIYQFEKKAKQVETKQQPKQLFKEKSKQESRRKSEQCKSS